MKTKFYFLVMASLVFTACASDEPTDDGIIRLSSSVASAITRANTSDAIQNAQFISDARIFVEAYKTGQASTYTTGIYRTTDAAGAMSGSLYYPSDRSNIDICAYYPSSVNSSTTSFSVNASQTTTDVANYRSSDLMYATKLTNKAKGSTHPLTFNHALTKIIVTITNGDGVSGDDISDNVTAVKINNTMPTAGFTISDGAVGNITASGTAADIDITGTTKTNHTGIIVPQTLTANTTFITVTYNNADYTYAIPSGGKTFDAGKVYTYALTLSAAGISLSSASITDWTADSGDSQTITL